MASIIENGGATFQGVKVLLHENPLNGARLGAGFMRVTTALPEDNAHFLDALKELL